jgi:hypothetical protein
LQQQPTNQSLGRDSEDDQYDADKPGGRVAYILEGVAEVLHPSRPARLADEQLISRASQREPARPPAAAAAAAAVQVKQAQPEGRADQQQGLQQRQGAVQQAAPVVVEQVADEGGPLCLHNQALAILHV